MHKVIIMLMLSVASVHQAAAQAGGKVHHIPVDSLHLIYAIDYPGEGTPFLLLHGFPDNKVIYDRLITELQGRGRRCIVIDFVGWGEASKPSRRAYAYSVAQQVQEIEAVVAYFALPKVSLVAHDMSGPPAIDFAIAHEPRMEELILLNTYYHHTPNRREPPAITLFSAPLLKHIFTPFGRLNVIFRPVFKAQMKPFFHDAATRQAYVPAFMPQFVRRRSSKTAMFTIISQVPKDVRAHVAKLEQLRAFSRPVKIIFGQSDPYLGQALAEEFHQIFPQATLHLIDQCRHYPQIEFAALTAALMTP